MANFLIFASEPGFRQILAQCFDFLVDIDAAQQLANRFGTHQCTEVVAVFLGLRDEVVLGHQLPFLQRCEAGIDHAERLEIQHALDIAQRHVEHHPHAGRQALQEPDMRGRAGELDVAHALTAHLGQRDFNAAFFADHATVLQPLVLAAQALVVLDRAENLGAKKAVALGLERAVVDGFRFFDFAE